MNNITTIEPVRPKAKISEQEMARRRKLVRKADANNRLEGIYRGAETNEIVESFVRGEIEVTELVSLFKAQPANR
jgi:hypothetical protein